jgi:hypothetical protein
MYLTGKWGIKPPFVSNVDGVYTCKAIKSFEDLRLEGVDPFINYYEPFGITRAVFDADEQNLVNIVTLMSDANPTIYIPDSYILSFPDKTSIPYRHVVLSVSLGAVPDTLTFFDLKTKIKNIVLDSIGVNSTVKEHQAGSVEQWLTQQEHDTAESNRKARFVNNQSLYSVIKEKDARILQLEEKLRTSEQVINSLMNPPAP